MNNTPAAATFLNEGQVTVDPAGLMYVEQTYNAAGRISSGPFYLVNCRLLETASPASTSTILIGGTGDTLTTDNLAGNTLWVNGAGSFGDGVLNLGGSLSNVGTILLESSNGGYQSAIVTGSSTLTNAPGGTIQINVGSGGTRIASGNVFNAGTINFDADTNFGGSGANPVNSGLMSIAGATVNVIGNSFVNQVGGLVSGYGTFNTSGVTLSNQGIIDYTVAPSILGVDVEPSTIAISYYAPAGMDAASVANTANYSILGSGGDGLFGNGNDVDRSNLITNISYDPKQGIATLRFAGDLPADFYRIGVIGTAVHDTNGTVLWPGGLDFVNRVLGVVPARSSSILDPASDSGASNHDGITNVSTPTFDVQVNQGGTITVDLLEVRKVMLRTTSGWLSYAV